jgi:hypothetical protein
MSSRSLVKESLKDDAITSFPLSIVLSKLDTLCPQQTLSESMTQLEESNSEETSPRTKVRRKHEIKGVRRKSRERKSLVRVSLLFLCLLVMTVKFFMCLQKCIPCPLLVVEAPSAVQVERD